jgi:hypothetical protein
VKYKLGSCWYITIKVWNNYNGNIAVAFFVIKMVIIGVKFKIIVIFKMTAESSYHLSFTCYIRRKHLNSIITLFLNLNIYMFKFPKSFYILSMIFLNNIGFDIFFQVYSACGVLLSIYLVILTLNLEFRTW